MSETENVEAINAWVLAKNGLDLAAKELRAAKAGYDTAVQCEREAWVKIQALRNDVIPPPPETPPTAAPATTQLISSYMPMPPHMATVTRGYGTHGYGTR